VTALAADVASLHAKLASIATTRATKISGKAAQTPPAPVLVYEVEPGSIVHAGDVYCCAWTATISVPSGDRRGNVTATHRGMARVAFDEDDRLSEVHLRFDVLYLLKVLSDLATAPTPAGATEDTPFAAPG